MKEIKLLIRYPGKYSEDDVKENIYLRLEDLIQACGFKVLIEYFGI